jgi:uncharacterized protein (DUF4415 family)
MPTKSSKAIEFTDEELADVESSELTDEELASLRPASEALPAKLYAALTVRKPGQRGPQKAPTKESITVRVDRDVVAAYRATGPGWQSLLNTVLRTGLTAKGKPRLRTPPAKQRA